MDASRLVEEYELPSGQRPFERFVRTLSGNARARVASLTALLAHGKPSGFLSQLRLDAASSNCAITAGFGSSTYSDPGDGS